MPAYYADTVRNFLNTPVDELLQQLTRAYESDRYKELMIAQISAWREQIEALKRAFASEELTRIEKNDWGIALEFVIPRRMGRIDVVLLIQGAVIGLEFKTQAVDSSAAHQIEDYCLDLLHFHSPSHGRPIYPVVIRTVDGPIPERRANPLGHLHCTKFLTAGDLSDFLSMIANRHAAGPQIPIQDWDSGEYRPVPTIVEAAIGMFAEMDVSDIARADCDPINLTATIASVQRIAEQSMQNKHKTICFITGVPGAGKTLAGLKLVHDRKLRDLTRSDSVFLTGNLPLVKVIRAALALDIARRKKQGLRASSRDPRTTIDTVLGYKRTHTRSSAPPHEQIIVFDEAQRAWNAERTAEYLDDASWIGYSEPELLMAILDRHEWAVLVALVGGGQEINRGEAGIGEWGKALKSRFSHWQIAVSEQALNGAYGAGAKLFGSDGRGNLSITVDPNLHLDNPTRQFRGKTMAKWAESLLSGDCEACLRILSENPEYPVHLTRDLEVAKEWLRATSKGTERYGCIASSEARRLRAEGLELPPARADGVEHWFLSPRGDIRSSFQLEIAANEFQIQGLEIDWACICWGGDFVRDGAEWKLKKLRGTAWQKVGNRDAQSYIVNSYRVLLTRARQGMVLFVPQGDDTDSTRSCALFDSTADFLRACGARPLPVM